MKIAIIKRSERMSIGGSDILGTLIYLLEMLFYALLNMFIYIYIYLKYNYIRIKMPIAKLIFIR